MNRKEAKKAARERDFFHIFIEKKPDLRINPKSVESCCQPKPDILCFQENERVAFELVELCDEDIARIEDIARMKGSEFLWTSDPSENVIREKLKKNYPTEYPVELLCYTDGRTVSWDQLIIETIRPLIDVDNGQFRRIWLLGVDECHQVWPYQKKVSP